MAKPDHRQREKDSQGNEFNRRRAPRLAPSAIPELKSARLLAGPEIQLINLSRGGALLESDTRIIPGANICIRLVAADAVFLLRGRVLRSRASQLRGSALVYECAIAFDEEFPLLPRSEEEAPNVAEKNPGPSLEEAAKAACDGWPAAAGNDPADPLTVTVPVPESGPDLRQIFGLNNW
ncbi:MAG: PilZ domain protein [Acidobacteria bacterium]|nr:PilZ domain protein [Acidobacteriota bacterium]